MRKRWLSALLCLCLVLSLLPMAAHAQTLETYLALGDSITTGYGLGEGEQSFAEQAAQASGLTLEDSFAQNGLTSAELLAQLSREDVKAAVTGADFITITIGGNDLLDALYGYLAEEYTKGNPDDPMDADDVVKKLESLTISMDSANFIKELISYMPGFITSDAASTALDTYSDNLHSILTSIQGLNSDVQMVVLNQYNPYKQAAENANPLLAMFDVDISSVSDTFEDGVIMLNDATAMVVRGFTNVQVADVKTVFDEQDTNPCNANFNDALSFDIHPNAAGHQLLAGVVAKLWRICKHPRRRPPPSPATPLSTPTRTSITGCTLPSPCPRRIRTPKSRRAGRRQSADLLDDYWFNFNSTTPTVVVSDTYFMGIMAGLKKPRQ